MILGLALIFRLVKPLIMSEHEQDLQDLSANDADELKAFVAKGRWFEAKLKVISKTFKTC